MNATTICHNMQKVISKFLVKKIIQKLWRLHDMTHSIIITGQTIDREYYGDNWVWWSGGVRSHPKLSNLSSSITQLRKNFLAALFHQLSLITKNSA